MPPLVKFSDDVIRTRGTKYKLIQHHCCYDLHTHTHTHTFNGPLSGTTRVSRYQKGKTNLDFTGARDSEWQWHQLGHMQVCTSLQTDNHASTSLLSMFTGRMPFLPPNQQCQSTEGSYDLRKFNFTNWVIPIRNSLSNHVVSVDTVNCFKNHLDKFWSNQEVLYNHKADLHGTGNHSILE